MTHHDINELIKVNRIDTNLVSDGFHTFNELYEHRIVLFMALCKILRDHAWKSKFHDDGVEWKGWFILGIFKEEGKQITYHLPTSKWEQLSDINTIERAPKWDGHNSQDVLIRLMAL